MQHKHKGMVRSDTGVLRNHPVTQQHKDPKVQAEHNKEIGIKKVEKVIKVFKQPQQKYLIIDVDKLKEKGVLIKFTRIEGRKRREVTLQIDKKQ